MLNTIININLQSETVLNPVNLIEKSDFWTYINNLLNNAQKLLKSKSRPNEGTVLSIVYEIEHIQIFIKSIIDKKVSSKMRQKLKRKLDRIDRYLPQLVIYLPVDEGFPFSAKIEKIETQNANVVKIYSAMGKEIGTSPSNLSVPLSKSEFERMRMNHEAEQRSLAQHHLPVDKFSRVTTQNPEVAYLYQEMGKKVIFETA